MVCKNCKKEKPLVEYYLHQDLHRDASRRQPCKDCRKRIDREQYRTNKERRKRILARNSEYQKSNRSKMNALSNRNYHRRRIKVLEYYGAKCACCGETAQEFLAVDHINGGGRQHRKSLGTSIFAWLIRNNYPDGFQLLCHNCNHAKHVYNKCPHIK